jgi:hypothetical protein
MWCRCHERAIELVNAVHYLIFTCTRRDDVCVLFHYIFYVHDRMKCENFHWSFGLLLNAQCKWWNLYVFIEVEWRGHRGLKSAQKITLTLNSTNIHIHRNCAISHSKADRYVYIFWQHNNRQCRRRRPNLANELQRPVCFIYMLCKKNIYMRNMFEKSIRNIRWGVYWHEYHSFNLLRRSLTH